MEWGLTSLNQSVSRELPVVVMMMPLALEMSLVVLEQGRILVLLELSELVLVTPFLPYLPVEFLAGILLQELSAPLSELLVLRSLKNLQKTVVAPTCCVGHPVVNVVSSS